MDHNKLTFLINSSKDADGGAISVNKCIVYTRNVGFDLAVVQFIECTQENEKNRKSSERGQPMAFGGNERGTRESPLQGLTRQSLKELTRRFKQDVILLKIQKVKTTKMRAGTFYKINVIVGAIDSTSSGRANHYLRGQQQCAISSLIANDARSKVNPIRVTCENSWHIKPSQTNTVKKHVNDNEIIQEYIRLGLLKLFKDKNYKTYPKSAQILRINVTPTAAGQRYDITVRFTFDDESQSSNLNSLKIHEECTISSVLLTSWLDETVNRRFQEFKDKFVRTFCNTVV